MRFVNTKSKTKKTVNNISKKVYNHNTTLTETDYLGGFQYKKEPNQAVQLQFFPTAEGYVNNTVVNGINQYSYVYNYTDHLGNIRLSYKKNGTTLQILEENNYYPFGLKHTYYNTTNAQPNYKYKYNGKEYQDELGLNVYDMDMRQYDPAIARWTVQDPVVHHSMSPYNAFDNNPVFWADPSGADSIYNYKTNQYVINGKVVTQEEAIAYVRAGGNADGSNNNVPVPQGKTEISLTNLDYNKLYKNIDDFLKSHGRGLSYYDYSYWSDSDVDIQIVIEKLQEIMEDLGKNAGRVSVSERTSETLDIQASSMLLQDNYFTITTEFLINGKIKNQNNSAGQYNDTSKTANAGISYTYEGLQLSGSVSRTDSEGRSYSLNAYNTMITINFSISYTYFVPKIGVADAYTAQVDFVKQTSSKTFTMTSKGVIYSEIDLK